MIILISIIIIVAIYHLVWESAFLPTYRLNLRNRLFKLRDEIRNFKTEEVNENDKNALILLHHGVNYYAPRLSSLTLTLQAELDHEYENNPKLRERIAKRRKTLEKAEHEEIIRIYREANEILEDAFALNAGGWFVYIVPIALIVAIFISVRKLIRHILSKVIRLNDMVAELIVMPSENADNIIPEPN